MDVAVVVSGGVAETVQCSPLVAAIAAGRGEPVLLACPPEAEELGRLLTGVGTVLPLPALTGRASRTWQIWAALRSRRVGVAVLCSDRPLVRAAVYAAAVPRRFGCHSGASDLLLTDVAPCGPDENRGQAWLRLAPFLGVDLAAPAAPSLALPLAIEHAAQEHLMTTRVGDGRLLVAIAPGRAFGEPGEEWNPARWAHLANRLSLRHGAGVVIVGDERDREVAEAMRVDLAVEPLDLCGELDITGTAGMIARCDLLVSADTPLLQVAAGVGTPSVGLFAGTDGRRRGAAGAEHRIVQALPQGREPASLAGIRVDDVLAAIEGSA